MKKKIALIATTAALATLIVAGGTLAWFQKSSDVYDNKITVVGKGVDIVPEDTFPKPDPEDVKPGGHIKKEVGMTSTGDVKTKGRINVKMYWAKTDDQTKTPVDLSAVNPAAKPSLSWLEMVEPSEFTHTPAEEANLGTKGVFFYTPKEMVKNKPYKLFTQVNLPEELSNEIVDHTLHVEVYFDAMQTYKGDNQTELDWSVIDNNQSIKRNVIEGGTKTEEVVTQK